MSRTAAAQKSATAFSRRTLVKIERDMTTSTPKVVWEHEIPVLEAVFGEGKVTQVSPKDMDEGYTAKPSASMLVHNKKQDPILPPSETAGLGYIFVGDPDAEYERLASVYGRDDEGELQVEKAYGRRNAGGLASMLKMPRVDDLPPSQLRQVLYDNGIDVPEDAKTASDLVKVAKEAEFELA